MQDFPVFCPFNNSCLWTKHLVSSARLWLDGSSAAGLVRTWSSASYWSDTCLGRGSATTRLCPGKMALEEQCSAPPQWRAVSLTYVEFPEGRWTRRVSPTAEALLTGRGELIFEERVCSLATERTRSLVILPNCETPQSAARSRECNPTCKIVSHWRMRSGRHFPQWSLANLLAVLISALL